MKDFQRLLQSLVYLNKVIYLKRTIQFICTGIQGLDIWRRNPNAFMFVYHTALGTDLV